MSDQPPFDQVGEFKCRDCGILVVLPPRYMPEYARRVVALAVSMDGETEWDKKTAHLCVTDFDGWAVSPFAQCRKYGTGERLTLAMIRRELAAPQ